MDSRISTTVSKPSKMQKLKSQNYHLNKPTSLKFKTPKEKFIEEVRQSMPFREVDNGISMTRASQTLQTSKKSNRPPKNQKSQQAFDYSRDENILFNTSQISKRSQFVNHNAKG